MICPSCHESAAVTESNYGALYTCPKCQAVYFINFDGQPEFDQDPAENIQSVSIDEIPQFKEEPLELSPELDNPVTQIEPLTDFSGGFESPLPEFNQNEFSADLNPFESLQEVVQTSHVGSTDFKINQPSSQTESFQDIASGLVDFGNSETQISQLNYDLKISGIDSAEILSLVKEALDDLRFGWQSDELIRLVKNGEIHFEKLNPVKAFILAKRLQFIDVEKHWKQNAL